MRSGSPDGSGPLGSDWSDVTTTNATVANFAGSGASYTFNLVPAADGTVTANIAANARGTQHNCMVGYIDN